MENTAITITNYYVWYVSAAFIFGALCLVLGVYNGYHHYKQYQEYWPNKLAAIKTSEYHGLTGTHVSLKAKKAVKAFEARSAEAYTILRFWRLLTWFGIAVCTVSVTCGLIVKTGLINHLIK